MKIFVTGATGFIGANLVKNLADKGHIVHALIRSETKAEQLKHKNVVFCKGDISDTKSIENAMIGCDYVYHAAAFAQVWDKDPNTFHRLNVDATDEICRIALQLQVKKMVYVSTAGVLGSSIKETVTETIERSIDYFTEYESTKALSEERVKAWVAKGLDVVIVNPTRVYGPGELSKSNSVTIMIDKYIKGKWHVNPGDGASVGNYVFVMDVVEGMQLAMEKGVAGERYILGGENVSYTEFFAKLASVWGRKCWLVKLPTPIMLVAANSIMLGTKLFGIKPLITPAWAKRFLYHWLVSSKKAEVQLGYKITSLEQGMKTTIDWLLLNHRKN
ncbi:MAG: SDR family NAD(P)-dependent oxidoreductase [Bacteroidales bacterium]|nr:SDR family NAD(P)-dependent oxidoreductase [Bacteroidales bacterium]